MQQIKQATILKMLHTTQLKIESATDNAAAKIDAAADKAAASTENAAQKLKLQHVMRLMMPLHMSRKQRKM